MEPENIFSGVQEFLLFILSVISILFQFGNEYSFNFILLNLNEN